MIAVRRRGLPSWALPSLALLGVVVACAVVAHESQRYSAVVLLLGLLTVASLGFLAWWSDPAWSFSGAVACSIFSGNWTYLGLPIGPDRLLFAVGVLAVLLRAPGARDRPPIPSRLVHWLLAVVAVLAVSSAVIAGTIHESKAFYGLLDHLGVVPFLAFLLAPVVFRTKRQRGILLGALVATGAYLGLTALFETVGPRSLVYPSFILDPSLGIHYGRARGPFLEAAANGLALYACAVAAAIAFVTWTGRRPRIAAAATCVLCLLGTALTLTRAIWLATVIATVLTLAVVPRLRRYLIPTVAGLAAIVAGAFLLIPSFSQQAQSRQSEQIPVWDRLNTDRAALNMVSAEPLLGFGWGSFPEKSPPYFDQAADYPITGVGLAVHNVFLSYAVELGLIGALLWITAFGLALGGAISFRGPPELAPWRIGLIAVAIHWIFVANFIPLTFAFPNMLIWLWAGVVIGPRWVDARASRPDPVGRPTWGATVEKALGRPTG